MDRILRSPVHSPFVTTLNGAAKHRSGRAVRYSCDTFSFGVMSSHMAIRTIGFWRVLALLAVFTATVAPALAQEEDHWNKLQEDGMTALNENRFSDAERCFVECLKIA